MARLAQAGIDPELLSEVAEALFTGEIEGKKLSERRRNERERKAKSRDVTGQAVTSEEAAEIRATPALDKETPQTPKEIKPSPCVREPRPWALPAGVSLQVWTDFLSNRKRKRLGNTPTAWKSFNDDLARVSALTGIPPPQLIEQCTAKGWGAIYDPRDQHNDRHERTNGLAGNKPGDGLSATTRAARDVFGPIGASH